VTVLEQPAAPSSPDGGPGNDNNNSTTGGLVFVGMAGLLIALVATVVIIGLIGLLRDEGSGGASGGGDGAAAAGPSMLAVNLSEFAIRGELSAVPGDVSLLVTNNGSQQHNVVLRETGAETPILNSGATATLDLGTLEAGTYELFCSIVGHVESGMVASLEITDNPTAGGDASASGSHDHTSPDFDADAMDQKMIDSMLAFPAETEGLGNELLEYELLPGGIKQFELTAAITEWEVAPGEFVEAWSYNGIVPGPMIKVDVGDTVRVIFNNETPMASDIHWHGLPVPNDQDGVSPYTQDLVKSGESFTYEFTLEQPMIAMYHAHMHSQISVPNGMFAAFIVGENPIPYGETISGIEIPEDLVLAEEIPMVLNDAGVIGLTLNGKSFPATAPLVLQEGEWASVHYYNEGLTAHPMHLHGFPQLVYAKDGIPLDYPYWADTINVAPGERFSVLFQGSMPGVWVWHCHILTHVESEEGLFGMATAVIVEAAATGEESADEEPATEDASAEG
jgi:manganese oxidase